MSSDDRLVNPKQIEYLMKLLAELQERVRRLEKLAEHPEVMHADIGG